MMDSNKASTSSSKTQSGRDIDNELHELCCVKCKDPKSQHEDLTYVKKGFEKLVEYSKEIGDHQMTEILVGRKASGTIIRIHRDCQKSVYNEMKRKASDPVAGKVKIQKVAMKRSEVPRFDWKKECMFCEKECLKDEKHPDRIDWRQVQVLPMRETLLSICFTRNDKIAENLKCRLLDCYDLVAVEARYHFQCRREFKTNMPTGSPPGRPTDLDRMINFNTVCKWLESEAEIYSLTEIYEHMVKIGGSEESVYSQKWLKTKLKERYGDHVSFSECEGKGNKVCFRNMVDYLINDKWYQDRRSSIQGEADRIIFMAANIILDDIRSTNFDCEWYPSIETMQSTENALSWIPSKLRLFLQCICKNQLHQSSIGQALVSSARPRSCHCSSRNPNND